MIIGLHAQAGAGKDAFADRLVEKHGFVKRGFAAPLYEEIADAFRVTVPWMQDRSRKEEPQRELRLTQCADGDFVECMRDRDIPVSLWLSPRQVLQWWGTEFRRSQDNDYWLKRMAVFCRAAHDTGAKGVAVPDTRFENEAQFIHDAGGVVIRIERTGLPVVESGHVSSKKFPPHLIDYTVWNDRRLADLHNIVDRFMAYRHEEAAAEVGG
jgi:hypothetical protein